VAAQLGPKRPCEYCQETEAEGRASNGAHVCVPCYEDHHGPVSM
jgi:formylmethanofuran dehydrogenase subunit E